MSSDSILAKMRAKRRKSNRNVWILTVGLLVAVSVGGGVAYWGRKAPDSTEPAKIVKTSTRAKKLGKALVLTDLDRPDNSTSIQWVRMKEGLIGKPLRVSGQVVDVKLEKDGKREYYLIHLACAAEGRWTERVYVEYEGDRALKLKQGEYVGAVGYIDKFDDGTGVFWVRIKDAILE